MYNKQNMSINFKPSADRIIIRGDTAEEKTAGGIIIPDGAKERPNQYIFTTLGGEFGAACPEDKDSVIGYYKSKEEAIDLGNGKVNLV